VTQTPRPSRQAPGIHHKAVGDIVVTALNDGMFEGSFAMLAAFEAGIAERMHRARFRAIPPRLAVNCFLIQTADRTILVDSGCGSVFGPDLGKLAGNLAALGVKPGDVDTVLCTHLHPDHVGGLVDGDGKAVFPAAELVMHADDRKFWGDDATLAGAATDDMKGYVALARSTIAAYADRTKLLTKGEALSGISIVPEPGHTPGHCGWLIASGGASLLIWGDIVHMPGIQFARPDAGMGFDIDGGQAVVTRQRIMDMVTTDRLMVAGMHLDFPCFGHVAKASEGYAFVPDVWTPNL
jgi:glyoxylase-like metal-dependent hydrolase (beta-lactamase superfamily II)